MDTEAPKTEAHRVDESNSLQVVSKFTSGQPPVIAQNLDSSLFSKDSGRSAQDVFPPLSPPGWLLLVFMAWPRHHVLVAGLGALLL